MASALALLDRIGHRQQAGQRAAYGHGHDRLALVLQAGDVGLHRRGVDATLSHQRRAAQQDRLTVDRGLDAAAGDRVERLDLAERHTFGPGILDDRLGQRMLAGALGAGGEV